jgi:hypothetical protein
MMIYCSGEKGRQVMDRIHLNQDRVQGLGLVNKATKYRVLKGGGGELLANIETDSL